MEPSLRNSLDGIFAKYEAAGGTAATALDVAERKNAKFLADFIDKRETVLRPVMEATGRFLFGKGFHYEIVGNEDGVDGFGREIEARIGLIVIKPPRLHRLEDYPGLTAICEKRSKLVRFRSRGQWPGQGGRGTGASSVMTLQELTCTAVQEKLLDVLAELFR